MRDFNGYKHTDAKATAENLMLEMETTIQEVMVEIFNSDLTKLAKAMTLKTIAVTKLAILDGWDIDEVHQETKDQYYFWVAVENNINI